MDLTIDVGCTVRRGQEVKELFLSSSFSEIFPPVKKDVLKCLLGTEAANQSKNKQETGVQTLSMKTLFTVADV